VDFKSATKFATKFDRRITPVVHFVGFTDDRFWSAVKVWGRPEYIHRGWDLRARRELHPADTIVFAEGEHDQPMREKSYSDIKEPKP
jgi:hypothetical protein